jgi:hypothetical protein
VKRVHEYEVWSKPGRVLSQDFGKEIQADVWASGIPRDVFLGVSNIPDESDIATLTEMIESRLVEEQQFYAFCKSNNLPPRRDNQTSAAHFIEFVRGCCVGWVHIPEGPDEIELLRQVEAAVARFDLAVRAP